MWAFLPVVATTLPPLLRDGEGDRPTLSGPEQILDDGLFRIHYTREGADAADDELLDAILAGLHGGQQAFEAEGWRPLRADDGTGGTTAIDVYVQDVDIFGYATPVTAPDGSWSCFLQIDNSATVGGRVAESVALHELHHCVQFRYTVTTAPWLFESAATYEQYSHVTDPLLDVAVGVLYGTRLEDPSRKLSSTWNRDEYAAFVWMKFWSELGGSPHPERLPALWEELAVHDDWTEALDTAARDRFDLDLGELFVEHATWNSFACASDDGAHYRSDVLPCIAEVSAPITPWDGAAIDVVHEDGPYTASFFETEISGLADVELSCEGSDVQVALVQVQHGGRRLGARGDGEATLPMQPGDLARAIVAGTGDAPLDATCTLTELPPGSRSGCSHTGTGWAWLALVPAFLARRRSQRLPKAKDPTRKMSGSGLESGCGDRI